MEFLQDWKFWTFVISFLNLLGIVAVGVFHKLATDKITNNDLKHLSDDVKEIKSEQKCIKLELVTMNKEIGYLKGKIEI